MRTKIILLLAIMLFCATSTFAQGGTTGPLTWNLDNGTLTISGNGAMPDYSNPYYAPWYPYRASIHTIVIETGVTTIGDFAFYDCSSLTSITIPNSVTTIEDKVFAYCTSLFSITLPNSLTTIGETAFYSCTSLTSILLPNSVATIGYGAFAFCSNLTSVTLGNSVTTIGYSAFMNCTSLPSIIIPNSVTTIGNSAFFFCTSLTSVTLGNSVTTIGYSAFTNCINLPSIIIPDGVTTIENGIFSECHSLTSVTLPNSITTIGNGAFAYCYSLFSIAIPGNVTKIGYAAFYYCTSLPSVTIPNGITRIEDLTFGNCESLPSLTIPNSITWIGELAFSYCIGLPSITIPQSVKNMQNEVFYGCTGMTSIEVESENNYYASGDGVLFNKNKTSLICYPAGKTESSYVIPSSVTNVKRSAFAHCTNLISIEVESENKYYASEDGVLFNKNKTTLICCPAGKTGAYIIPDNVIIIEDISFHTCKSLTSVIIPNSVTTIRDNAFRVCPSLTSITIPNSVTTIGSNAFNQCSSLSSITIPNGITKIEDYTFFYCTNLTSVTIPSSVKKIGGDVFYNCPNLTLITNLNPAPATLYSYTFEGFNQSACTLKVPTSAVSAYQNADMWKEFNIVGGGLLVNPVANNSKYGYTTGDGLYQEGEMATVTATAYENCKFVNWTKSGVEVSRENTYIFFVTEDVELVAVFEEIVGIVETDNYPSLRVYPNPTTGEFKVSGFGFNVTGIEIFDMMGKQFQSLMFNVQGSGLNFKSETLNFETVIGISHLPAGIYFIRIQTEKGTVTRKVVKI